jgi:arylsulfatase A-like enzyme
MYIRRLSSCLLGIVILLSPLLIFADNKPNVILVITDDQGYGDLACHGNEIIQTPHLDRLHAESVRLTDFHVSPCCTPTRAGLMTGQNPVTVGAWGTTWGRSLPDAAAVMMADVFASNGYKTGCFGKWHLGDNYPFRPQDRGFQEVLVHGGGGVGQAPDFWGNNYFDDTYFRNGEPEQQEGYCTDVWFDAAWDYIESCGDAPFFVYLTTNAPHGPYFVADEYSGLYAENPDCPHAAFYGMITNIDDNMGRLVERLESSGLADDTILIFMTDNGTAAGFKGGKGFNAGMRGTKGSIYDGGHRVPFFIRWPSGGLTGGRDVDDLTTHTDIIPTLADLCRMEIPEDAILEGISLAPLMMGNTDSLADRKIFVQYRQSFDPPLHGAATVMTERWRLVSGKELYDIDADPGQLRNVSEQHPEIVEELSQAYDEWWNEISPDLPSHNCIVLGDEAENPAALSSFDWHTTTAWNQSHVRGGAKFNGFWAVDIAKTGTYEITLRRWPEVVNAPINAAIPGGAVIAADQARLTIADLDLTKPIPVDATSITFTVNLEQGETQLQTWLIDSASEESRGAYYTSVRLADEQK